MSNEELKNLLDDRVARYETPDFVPRDPVQFPRRFARRADIEIAGLLTSLISWGNRRAILKAADQMMAMLGGEPERFVKEASPTEIDALDSFVYRTFQGNDLPCYVRALRGLYDAHDSLEDVALNNCNVNGGMATYIGNIRCALLPALDAHAIKHLADPGKNSAAKRLCMFMRWMVRPASGGVDLGLWKRISPRELMIPLDVHVGNVARHLGMASRRQNDWKTAEEITQKLRSLRPDDPVAYDFALFSMGIDEGIK